jgi:hypothetical protein
LILPDTSPGFYEQPKRMRLAVVSVTNKYFIIMAKETSKSGVKTAAYGFVVVAGSRNGNFKDFELQNVQVTAVKTGVKMGEYSNCLGMLDKQPHIIGAAEAKAVQDLNPTKKLVINAKGELAAIGETGFISEDVKWFRKDGVLDAM